MMGILGILTLRHKARCPVVGKSVLLLLTHKEIPWADNTSFDFGIAMPLFYGTMA
jgi:hypothetical protein